VAWTMQAPGQGLGKSQPPRPRIPTSRVDQAHAAKAMQSNMIFPDRLLGYSVRVLEPLTLNQPEIAAGKSMGRVFSPRSGKPGAGVHRMLAALRTSGGPMNACGSNAAPQVDFSMDLPLNDPAGIGRCTRRDKRLLRLSQG
jgi:hypothetical protein